MEPTRVLSLLLALCICLQATTVVSIPTRLTANQHHARFLQTLAARSVASLAGAGANVNNSSRVFYPVSYGADPTGVEDSSEAILNALNDAFQVQKGHDLLPGINDLGGVIIDLQGGNYKINKPLRIPVSGVGNAVIQGGTLRASENFPMNEYLIELWSTSSERDFKPGGAVIYYEDITFRDILFDSGYLGGGLLIIDSARIRIDNCYFNHFGSEGILVSRGHEIFISSCFLGQHETVGGDPDERNFTGVGIDLASNDNTITDVAIFSAATGVILRGQANILTGVHCYNKATFWGGVGILVKLAGLGQTRIDNCYMDWTSIVMEDPAQVHVTNAFFLGNANVVLKSIKGVISGLNIVDNMFSGSGGTTPIVALDETITPFTTVDQVVVERNNVLDMQLKSTVARMAVAGVGKTWVADFSPMLVFPNRINHLQYSFYIRSGSHYKFSPHAVTNVSDNQVTVGSKRAVDAVVSIAVDQYAVPGELSQFM